MITRRGLLEAVSGAVVAASSGSLTAAPSGKAEPGEVQLSPALPAGTRAEAVLDTLPGKMPLIKLAYRPPNYEAPLAYLRTAITPNDEFFVRYHLADIPQVDASQWRLYLGGEGVIIEKKIRFAELKKLPVAEVIAVCECAGNRRGPHPPRSRSAMGPWRGRMCPLDGRKAQGSARSGWAQGKRGGDRLRRRRRPGLR
jgi:DMSO/TMAO reductase YedYZ molybdopterin-dependent catalytic subunit